MSSPPPLLSFTQGGGENTNTETITDYYNSTASSPPHHHSASSSFSNLSPSILVIVLILAITFIASISLCLLLRHLNRRCLRHLSQSAFSSSSSSSSSSTVIPLESHRISNRRVSPEDPTASFIDSLPLFTFSSVTRRSSSSGAAAADCAVCLSKFEPEDQLRLLPLCCHAFHALCVDTWLQSNQTCPLCRSPIFASETEILKSLAATNTGENTPGGSGGSFRLEIGSVSGRQTESVGDRGGGDRGRSYSIGSFEYLVEDDSEVSLSNAHRRNASDQKDDGQPPGMVPEQSLAAEVAVGSGRSWLKEYVDRLSMSLSSRALSFRSSGRFFTGSSRRSEVAGAGEWDMEAARVGEEISEMFRWFSGV